MTENRSSVNGPPTLPCCSNGQPFKVLKVLSKLVSPPPSQYELQSFISEMRFIFLIFILFIIKQHSSPEDCSKEKTDIYVLPNQKQIDKLLKHPLKMNASTVDFQGGFYASSWYPRNCCQASLYSMCDLTVLRGKCILILANKLDSSHFKMKTQPPLKV